MKYIKHKEMSLKFHKMHKSTTACPSRDFIVNCYVLHRYFTVIYQLRISGVSFFFLFDSLRLINSLSVIKGWAFLG